jgi:type III secretion protein V
VTAPARPGPSRARRAFEVAPGLAVVGLVALFFLPVSPALIDALVATSLGISAAVLLAVLLAPDALRLAAFPALLLLTTLLRLAVAIASTRLVLSRGEAGRVIEALGRVVMQGSWVAGAVVYAILALVQLLVVTRGAERVAEVAARFTLDAMPGKQMAIDAELRAGAIDAAEAGRRRRELERESQLHGAMDGALKFVKGDAVAGVAIALVNAGGGFVAGLARGMTPGASARRHVLLAVGDGLASQIPALLLAVAAGISVTRVAGDAGSVSSRIARELVAEPRALVATGAFLVAVGLAPGLPALPFLAAGGSLALAGMAGMRRAGGEPDAAPPSPAAPHGRPGERVAVELAEGLVPGGDARAAWLGEIEAALRRDLRDATGIPAPGVSVRATPLRPGAWRLLVDGAPAAAGAVPVDRALCLASPGDLVLAGIPASPSRHPQGGAPAAAIDLSHAERAAALGAVLDPPRRALAEVRSALRRSAHLLVGVQEVQSLLDEVEASAPALVREVARQVPSPTIAESLRRLLEEGVSVAPLRPILEGFVAAPPGASAAALAEVSRRALSRHITHGIARGRPLDALLLDPAAEVALRDALAAGETWGDATAIRALLDSISGGLSGAPGARALLAPADVRRPLRELVAQRYPELAVLAYEELPPDLEVRPVGRASFCE